MKRRTQLALVWIVPPAIFALATWHVQRHYAMPEPPARLDDAARTEVVRVLRAAIAHADAAPKHLDRALDDRGPLIVTVWRDGARAMRAVGRGDTLGAAVTDAAAQLRAQPPLPAADALASRIEVDLAVARAPLGDDWVFAAFRFPAMSAELADTAPIHPGLDGIGGAGDDAALLAPGELVTEDMIDRQSAVPLLPGLTPGLDRRKLAQVIARPAFRFRTDTFVERPLATRGDGAPIPLVRGAPPAPPVTAENLRTAAENGARYLVAHLGPDGRYVYEHDLASGRRTDPRAGNYSIPRHAGVTYFLAQVYRATGEPWLREPIERAASNLEHLVEAGPCKRTIDGEPAACVYDPRLDREGASLGSSALTVVALVEYERATQDARYRPLAEELTRWILWMQRDDGSFTHVYDVEHGAKKDGVTMLYFSGEAALALARMYELTHDARYAHAAERALDWNIAWYDFFLGGFFYGEEHWTCIAAEAIWPAVDKDAYQDFCDGYGAFLRDQQAGDAHDQEDFAGSYNEASPFGMPPNTPAGSRTEAMISAYLLGVHRKHPDLRIKDQIIRAAAYLLAQQVTPDGDFAAKGGDVDGGMPGSPIDRTVRIDYVQHTGSAMLRAAEILDQSPRP
ncbi:MAG TPA: prenyltransferase/squalene oxidase repeat-containing protein [Kofleriaceae bacterium]|nr:prenyltransferase/squalene oxidase repeat-containing protein [Kofleriaceae bacterium]